MNRIVKLRPELRLIITSATLDAEIFINYFNNNPQGEDYKRHTVVSVEGRQFPVNIQYLSEPSINFIHTTVETIISIHKNVIPIAVVYLLLLGTSRRYPCILTWKRKYYGSERKCA